MAILAKGPALPQALIDPPGAGATLAEWRAWRDSLDRLDLENLDPFKRAADRAIKDLERREAAGESV